MSSLESLFIEERAGGPFNVLTVCTGNICRSPLTEMLLRKTLHGLPTVIHSAGTQALTDNPMEEANQIIANELGVTDGHEHRARQLTREMLEKADLVLALSREHRAAVVELLPRASRRVYTLREFALLANSANLAELSRSNAELAEDRMRDFVEEIAQRRGSIPAPDDLNELDVIDPYGQGDEAYVESAGQITPAVKTIGEMLRRAAEMEAA